MAAGKNYTAQKLCQSGHFVSIDLDETVHAAIQNATPQILAAFSEPAELAGIKLQNADGSLDRRALGKLVFSSPELLARQESLVYPETVRLTKQFIEQNKGTNILINATVLYKTPQLLELCTKIFYVKAPFLTRLVRAKKRDRLPLRQILKRFCAQKKLLAEYKKTGLPIIFIKN